MRYHPFHQFKFIKGIRLEPAVGNKCHRPVIQRQGISASHFGAVFLEKLPCYIAGFQDRQGPLKFHPDRIARVAVVSRIFGIGVFDHKVDGPGKFTGCKGKGLCFRIGATDQNGAFRSCFGLHTVCLVRLEKLLGLKGKRCLRTVPHDLALEGRSIHSRSHAGGAIYIKLFQPHRHIEISSFLILVGNLTVYRRCHHHFEGFPDIYPFRVFFRIEYFETGPVVLQLNGHFFTPGKAHRPHSRDNSSEEPVFEAAPHP